MTAKEMLEKLGYACDEGCDGMLYSKWVYENDTDYEIQINFEKRPICFRKTRTKEIFNPSRPDDITLEELKAINKQIEECSYEIKRLKLVEQNFEEEKEYLYECYKDIELKAERSGK